MAANTINHPGIGDDQDVVLSGQNMNTNMETNGFERFTRQLEISPPIVCTGNTTKDFHVYYTSTFSPPSSASATELCSELVGKPGVMESRLSKRFRVYMTLRLLFEFLFYGHKKVILE